MGQPTAVFLVPDDVPPTPAIRARAIACVGLLSLSAQASPGAGFRPAPAAAGLDFEHENGATGALQILEIMGSGAALFDFDGDGDLDVLLRQGQATDGAVEGFADSRLFRNDLAAGELRFVDVTEPAGLLGGAYGMGVAVADYDGDGWSDLYLTNFGSNRLLRNRGGVFEDVTSAAGVDDPRWSVPAVFADFDGDGRLDLWVGAYVDYRPSEPRQCFTSAAELDYCGPQSHQPQSGRLFLNRGDGTFEDATSRWSMTAPANALGAVARDFDGDGWLDLFVASDARENHLWMNQQGRGFLDDALFRGVALNGKGEREGSMGVALADFDDDGDEDLFVTNLRTESHTLYAALEHGLFDDVTAAHGLARATWAATGFGVRWIDHDLDGDLDLFVVNGSVNLDRRLLAAGDPLGLGQPDQLLVQTAPGTFEDGCPATGALCQALEAGRGLASGDVDNDGAEDLLIANNSGPARLWLNEARNHWVGLRFVVAGGGAAEGPVVALRAGEVVRRRRADRSGSYASASDPRVRFGLGASSEPVELRIEIPGAVARRLQAAPTDRELVIEVGRR